MFTMLESVTINGKLSLVEFRDGKTTSLNLSYKHVGIEEAIIIGALLQVLVVCCRRAMNHASCFLASVSCPLTVSFCLISDRKTPPSKSSTLDATTSAMQAQQLSQKPWR